MIFNKKIKKEFYEELKSKYFHMRVDTHTLRSYSQVIKDVSLKINTSALLGRSEFIHDSYTEVFYKAKFLGVKKLDLDEIQSLIKHTEDTHFEIKKEIEKYLNMISGKDDE